MKHKNPIKLYDSQAFTAKFMPSPKLSEMLKPDFTKFFIVKAEDMYKLVQQAVPATRATTHSCIFTTSGLAIMKIGSQEYRVAKNEMLFVPAGAVFSFEPHHVNKGYLCNFHSDMLISKFNKRHPLKEFEFLNVWGNPHIKLDKQTAQFVVHLFKRILFDYSQNGIKNLNIIQPYLLTLLCEADRAYKPLSDSTQTGAVDITNRFKQLIFSNVKTQHLVTDYAKALNISPNHLNKTIKTITGKSPTKWIDEAIVSEAKVLLSQTPLSISQVAIEVGFDDQSYFTRLFKKYEGITPSQFLKMIEKS